MPVTPPVRLEGGAVDIGGTRILRDIDLSVQTGEFVALMGANGSGKSTLVRTLTGLRPLSEGSLTLFGTAYGSFHDWGRIGYVPQRASAASGVPASVWEVVASGRLTHRRLFRPLTRHDKDVVADAIDVVGLGSRTRQTVSTLSGGQQQRVMIARALAGEPELFFLDEPMAGVDLPNQQALADALRRLKERGATIVLVAHELGTIEPLIDRSVVLRDGRKVYDGACLSDTDVHLAQFDHVVSHHHVDRKSHDSHTPQTVGPLEREDPR
ncbi:MAG: ABC transporter ATP-binding protein [Nocardioides sp.]|nr:ABC transporter ATP-binding protein [Nocardioides sp.]